MKRAPRGALFSSGRFSAAGHALPAAVELHRLAAQGNVSGDLDRLHEGLRPGSRDYLAALGRDLVRVRGDHRVRLDELVDHVSRFRRAGDEYIADVDDGEVRLVVLPHDDVL